MLSVLNFPVKKRESVKCNLFCFPPHAKCRCLLRWWLWQCRALGWTCGCANCTDDYGRFSCEHRFLRSAAHFASPKQHKIDLCQSTSRRCVSPRKNSTMGFVLRCFFSVLKWIKFHPRTPLQRRLCRVVHLKDASTLKVRNGHCSLEFCIKSHCSCSAECTKRDHLCRGVQ